MFDFGVFIGRFEPFHVAHRDSVRYALERCRELVLVLGSTNRARNVKNPWTGKEREKMISDSLTADERARVMFIHAKDYLYNDNLWVASIQRQIGDVVGDSKNIALFGHKKDASSFYLKLFPQWQFNETFINSSCNASDVRVKYFTHDTSYAADLPNGSKKFLEEFKKTDEFKRLCDEYHHVLAYRESWRGAPFPPIFVTVDAVVIKSGHILIVKRKGSPGKGLLALPGGFLNQDERTRDGAIRELKEETGIKVPVQDLKDAICDSYVFDYPSRSLRGRTITHAYCINLKHGELPAVKGADDAEKAFWMPLNEVDQRESEFFEDHAFLIQYFVHKF